jgi:hypothetical protein
VCVQLLGSLLVDHHHRIRWGRLGRLYQGSSSSSSSSGEEEGAGVDMAVLMDALDDGARFVFSAAGDAMREVLLRDVCGEAASAREPQHSGPTGEQLQVRFCRYRFCPTGELKYKPIAKLIDPRSLNA